MHSLICPKCGATSDKIQFLGPFCINCSPIRIECPKEFIMDICSRCGRMRIARDWVKYDENLISRLLAKKCKGHFKKVDYEPSANTATVFIEKEGTILKLERTVKFRPNKVLCTDCSRRGSGYFEAIIQLRGRPERIAKYEKLLKSRLSETTFVAKTEDLKEGKDLYIGNSKAVIELFRELGLRMTISRKLHGVKQGRRLYRTTFLLRL